MNENVTAAEYTCEWFASCELDAVGLVEHPVLGFKPVCQRCTDLLDLDLIPWSQVEFI